MNLIDRYLTAVGQRVPMRVRSEVQAELRSAIADGLEDRSAAAHDEGAVVEVLKSIGSPARVAAAYHPAGQYLIGPELYPVFKKIIAITLTLQLILATGGFALNAFTQGLGSALGESLMSWIGWAAQSMAIAIGVVVLVFAGLQRATSLPATPAREWDPRSLPSYTERDLVSRAEPVFGLVMTAVLMVVINDVASALRADLPGSFQPLLARLLDRNIWLLNIALLIFVAVYVVLLLQGAWYWYTRTLRRVAEVIGVVVCTSAAFTIANSRVELQAAGLSANMINWLIYNAFAVAVVVAGVFLWQELRKPQKLTPLSGAGALWQVIAA